MDYPQYDPQSAVTPLAPEELDALDRLLQTLPSDATMSLDGVDGYLTALLVAPGDPLSKLPTSQWLPAVWGGDDGGGNEAAAPFASKRQRKATVVQLLRHLRHVQQQMQHEPEAWEPIFSIAEQGARDWVDARDWCAGFMQAVDLAPQDWDAVWRDPQLGPALAGLVQLGGGLPGAASDAEADAIDDPEIFDPLGRAVPDAVLQLLAARTAPSSPAP